MCFRVNMFMTQMDHRMFSFPKFVNAWPILFPYKLKLGSQFPGLKRRNESPQNTCRIGTYLMVIQGYLVFGARQSRSYIQVNGKKKVTYPVSTHCGSLCSQMHQSGSSFSIWSFRLKSSVGPESPLDQSVLLFLSCKWGSERLSE